MAKYKKCPRCELNYIPENEDYCEVCKVELGKSNASLIEDDDDEKSLYEERICPVCKINYLADDEDICASCREAKEEKKTDEKEEDWRDFVEEDISEDEEEGEISLSMLEDEAEEDDDI